MLHVMDIGYSERLAYESINFTIVGPKIGPPATPSIPLVSPDMAVAGWKRIRGIVVINAKEFAFAMVGAEFRLYQGIARQNPDLTPTVQYEDLMTVPLYYQSPYDFDVPVYGTHMKIECHNTLENNPDLYGNVGIYVSGR